MDASHAPGGSLYILIQGEISTLTFGLCRLSSPQLR